MIYEVVMHQYITFHKPNENMRNEKMMAIGKFNMAIAFNSLRTINCDYWRVCLWPCLVFTFVWFWHERWVKCQTPTNRHERQEARSRPLLAPPTTLFWGCCSKHGIWLLSTLPHPPNQYWILAPSIVVSLARCQCQWTGATLLWLQGAHLFWGL